MDPDALCFQQHPATHPALRQRLTAVRHGLEADGALAPGLAAEAVEALRLLPAGPHYVQQPDMVGLHWRCDATLPPEPSPQLPEPLFRLVRAVEEDIPAAVSAALGTALRSARPGILSLWRFQKGSWYHDTPAADGPVRFLVELTGARWPAAWGGTLDIAGQVRSLGWDRLTVLQPGTSLRVPLVRRHVSACLLYGELVPA